MNIVEVHNLSKKYPSFELKNVSFNIEGGRIVGFIGRNGAGKTTTIKSMLNIAHPDSGEIRFFGKSMNENESEIKKQIGYSTGTVSWYPRKKLGEMVYVQKKFYDTWDETTYRKYLNLFSLNEDKAPIEMSEGMKVKYNILLALSHKARLLILDEPTSGLDPFSREEILDIFTALKKEGIAVLFSTHIISDIEKCADDIMYIKNGKLEVSVPKTVFVSRYSQNGENLEKTVLRLERDDFNA